MTEYDGTGQLSDVQRRALSEILAGKTDEAVAQTCGVARQTINGWKNQNLNFQAELNKDAEFGRALRTMAHPENPVSSAEFQLAAGD